MNNHLSVIGILFLGAVIFSGCVDKEPAVKADLTSGTTIYDFTVNDIDGKEAPLSQYKGKVALIVNTASKCGFTPQYDGLEALYKKYEDQGFVILGFPANNFMGQEPGTNEEIQEFCKLNYGVTFPMFAKISVKGEDEAPLYQFLTSETLHPQFGGAITWNFNKFLVDRSGQVIARFGSRDTPEDPKLVVAVEKALAG